ncbi:putative RNA-directed DNA polymerase from transposon BS [Fusarium oxysporum f. sp. albedinis]|nr:putative RNA-directed DNA polymerase from transposon BS [Fusarium oxysporum f. sp. albedinis]
MPTQSNRGSICKSEGGFESSANNWPCKISIRPKPEGVKAEDDSPNNLLSTSSTRHGSVRLSDSLRGWAFRHARMPLDLERRRKWLRIFLQAKLSNRDAQGQSLLMAQTPDTTS